MVRGPAVIPTGCRKRPRAIRKGPVCHSHRRGHRRSPIHDGAGTRRQSPRPSNAYPDIHVDVYSYEHPHANTH